MGLTFKLINFWGLLTVLCIINVLVSSKNPLPSLSLSWHAASVSFKAKNTCWGGSFFLSKTKFYQHDQGWVTNK